MERIIHKLTDNDLYKMSMGQAALHKYPDVHAGYYFINRGKTQFPAGFAHKLTQQIEMMADLKLDTQEKSFLEGECPFLTKDYLDWFSEFSFDPSEVKVRQDGGELSIEINGAWHRSIYWEVPLLALISELYFLETGQEPIDGWQEKAKEKAELLLAEDVKYTDFGTRRRFSHHVHDTVVGILKQFGGHSFLGTSNIELALKYDLRPFGTFAHEWVMALAGLYGVENANRKALEAWAQEFQGKLSTALTDTYTTEVFLRSFDYDMSKTFKTLRQDSGSPESWTDLVVDHLRNKLGLNPLDFSALYSDSLNPQRAVEIKNYAQGKINSLFGIGTDISNDVGRKPLNMVIKMRYIMKVSGDAQTSVVKLSDDTGKISGDMATAQETMRKLGLVFRTV